MWWIGCVRHEKLQRDFVARTFALVRNVLPRVPLGNLTIPNAPKWYETHQNMSLGSNGVDRERPLRKIPTRLRGTYFCTSSERFAPSLVRKPSGPKWYETNQNMSLGFNGVDRVRSSRKTPTRLRGTNFCTSSERFAPSFARHPNGRKCTKTVRNTPKHEFWSNGVDQVRSSQKF